MCLVVLGATGCAGGQSGAWDEVSSPTSGEASYGGEYDTYGMEEVASAESVEAQYSVDRYEMPQYEIDRSAETRASGRSEASDGSSPQGNGGELSDWGTAPPPQAEPAPYYAQADPPEPRRGGSGGSGTTPAGTAPTATATATDAIPADTALLIYTATLTMAVLHVEEQQDAVQQLAESVNGYLAQRSARSIVVRVPVARFHEVLRSAEGFGDVIDRDVRTQDVGEEFRDTSIRLRNLEVMRTRLETLLAQAQNVNDALAVEREMQRVTEELERLRGRIRYLQDQISYSTITVHFRPRVPESQRVNEFRLPFVWLDRLGLPRLLEVR